MAKLYLDIKNQTLSVRCDIERIVENSINYLEYEIIATDDWEGLTKEVIVTYNNGKDCESHTNGKIKNKVICTPGFTINVVGYVLSDSLEDKQKKIKSFQITTNKVPIKVYPSGPSEGKDTPNEELEADDKARLTAVEQSIGGINEEIFGIKASINTTNLNLETLSQEVDNMKISTKVEDNVLYIYYENTLEQKEG